MSSVVTRVELSDKDIRDALLDLARELAAPANSEGASIMVSGEAVEQDGAPTQFASLKNLRAVAEFHKVTPKSQS